MATHPLRMALMLAMAWLMLPLAVQSAEPALQIEFKTLPDPPHPGSNTVEVTVRNAEGTPIEDASVEVRFHMAAMPSMNMPEMQARFATTHVANGIYRGTGRLVMSGSWDVAVTVTRAGTRLGRKTLTVLAK